MARKLTVFWTVYFTNLGLILLALLIGLVRDVASISGETSFGFHLTFYALFLGAPLAAPFAGMNVWAAKARSDRRSIYVLASLLFGLWALGGISAWFVVTLP